MRKIIVLVNCAGTSNQVRAAAITAPPSATGTASLQDFRIACMRVPSDGVADSAGGIAPGGPTSSSGYPAATVAARSTGVSSVLGEENCFCSAGNIGNLLK